MKKFTIFLFSLLVISFGFCNSVFGATNDMGKVEPKTNVTEADIANILDKIESTNVKIDDLIHKAILKTSEINLQEAKDISTLESEMAIFQADSERLEENSENIDNIRDEINNCKQEANCAIISIMEELIKVTDKIANDMASEAAKYGIIVINEYIPVTINGVVYWVDPLRVGRN